MEAPAGRAVPARRVGWGAVTWTDFNHEGHEEECCSKAFVNFVRFVVGTENDRAKLLSTHLPDSVIFCILFP